MKISNVNIAVDRKKCIACGACVDRCIMDNLRLLVAPCRQVCPLGINCQGYLRLLAQGEGEKAAHELRKYTPFAAVLGMVCTSPCESVCKRQNKQGEGAVRIREVKRHLAQAYANIVDAPLQPATSTGKSIAIVGSGPAGMQAAYELAMLGHKVSMFEAGQEAGGTLRQNPLPKATVDAAVTQITRLGVRITLNQSISKDAIANLQSTFDAVILCLGAKGIADFVNPQNIDTPTGQMKDMDNVFVAGFCGKNDMSVVHAFASGKQTALCVHRKVLSLYPIFLEYDVEAGIVNETDFLPCIEKKQQDQAAPLNANEAQKEASRCLSCGRAYEANNTCWYCLPCELDCPVQALEVKIPYLVR